MPRYEARRCSEDELPAVAKLVAELHVRARQAEPLLPAVHDDPAGALEILRRQPECWVATRNGAVVAVLAANLGAYGAWSPPFCAAGDPEGLTHAYAAAAAEWLAAGEITHSVHIPLCAPEIIAAFQRLTFGHQAEYGMHALKTLPAARPVTGLRIDIPGPADLDDLLPLLRALPEHLRESPAFMRRPGDHIDRMPAIHGKNLAENKARYFLARRDGRPAGLIIVWPAEDETELLDPPGGSYLTTGVVAPAERGTGVGLAVTRAALGDAIERGETGMGTDWRTTNLLASRFWPTVGFRPHCLRLSRTIDLQPR